MCKCNEERAADREHIENLAQRYTEATGEAVTITHRTSPDGQTLYGFEPISETTEGRYIKRIYPDGREVYILRSKSS